VARARNDGHARRRSVCSAPAVGAGVHGGADLGGLWRLPAGFVHCDVKPQNLVFFAAEGVWKLIDLATYAVEGVEASVQFSLR